MSDFEILQSKELIKGRKADYSPLYFFVYNGKIYIKLKDEVAYERGFEYPCVDILKG